MDTFEAIHPLFQAALDAVDRNFVYQGTIHHLGPRPLLDPRAQARVAIRCAELVIPLLDGEAARIAARKLLGALDAGLDQREYDPPARPYYNNVDDPTANAVVDLAHSAVVHACARSRNTWRTARAAVGHAARLVVRTKAEPGPAGLLDRVDAWIMRGELETVARRRHAALIARVAAVLYRSGEYPARPQVWLVRLIDGQLALLQRVRGQLLVTEGRDEDVLATVPDAHFDYCVAAARAAR